MRTITHARDDIGRRSLITARGKSLRIFHTISTTMAVAVAKADRVAHTELIDFSQELFTHKERPNAAREAP